MIKYNLFNGHDIIFISSNGHKSNTGTIHKI